jgi:hypothetical protein
MFRAPSLPSGGRCTPPKSLISYTIFPIRASNVSIPGPALKKM